MDSKDKVDYVGFSLLFHGIVRRNILAQSGIDNTYKIKDTLYVGEHPCCNSVDDILKRLLMFKRAGVEEFIDLACLDEYPDYISAIDEFVEHTSFPINEKSIPLSVEYMYEIVSYIDSLQARGRRCYLHCGGGYGRSSTVAACYFVYCGDTPKDAVDKLGKHWKVCRKAKEIFNPFETPEQATFVSEFAKYITTKRADIDRDNMQLSQIRGSLLGGAVGDALGYAVEFDRVYPSPRKRIASHTQ